MKRVLSIACLASLAAFSFASESARFDGDQLHRVTGEYRTPHLDWGFGANRDVTARRVLFIVPRNAAREVVELVQRLPVAADTVVAKDFSRLAVDNVYESLMEGTSPFAKNRELLGRLEQDYDLIVCGNFNFRSLSHAAQYRILTQVREGAGLLFFHEASGRRLPFAKLYTERLELPGGGTGFPPIPGQSDNPAQAPSAWRVGKGRLVHVPYGAPALRAPMALTPAFPADRAWQANYENSLASVMSLMLWAAPRVAATTAFACPALDGTPVLPAGGTNVALSATGPDSRRLVLGYRIRDAVNRIVAVGEAKSADGAYRLAVPALPGGRYVFDVMARRGRATVGMGLYPFVVESRCGPLAVRAPDTVFDGEPFDGRLTLDRPLAGAARLRVSLLDSPGHRTWHRREFDLPVGTREYTFRLSGYPRPSIAGYLVGELLDADGHRLGEAEQVIAFPDYRMPGYLNFTWQTLPEGMGPLMAKPTIETLGWEIGLTHPDGSVDRLPAPTLLNQRQVVYTTRIVLQKGAKGEAKQYSWFFLGKEDREAAEKLGDDNCFYRPEVRELWRRGIRQRIEGLPRQSPVIYSLGDENALDLEAGFGPHDLKYFREFVARKYGGIAALNREWGRTFKDFSEVPHPTLQEARAATNFPAWLDHRQYMEQMYADIHHFCRDVIREADPRARVGAEGSVPGDLELTMGRLDFWAPYSDPIEDEVLRSLGGDKIRTHWWGGLTRGNHVLFPQQLSHVLKGSVTGSAWYIGGAVTEVHSALGVDYSLPGYVKRYLPAMDLLRYGVGQLLIENPLLDSGVRFFWSPPSNAAKLLDPRFIAPDDGLSTLLDVAYQTGVNFDFVSERTLARLADPKARMLFLCGASALSDGAVRAILAFAERGGTVVADLNPALLNDCLRVRDTNPLAPLLGDAVLRGLPEPERLPVDIQADFNGASLAFRAAKALSTPGQPACQVRTHGRGRGVLLNLGWSSAANTADAATPVTDLFEGLLRGAGAMPAHRVEGAPAGTMVRVREGRGFTLVGMRIPDRDLAARPACRVALPGRGYLYRCDQGYAGRGDRVTGAFKDLPFALFAVFPERQQAPRVRLPASVARGETARVELADVPSGRIVRVAVAAPDGSALTTRCQVISRDRTAECLLPFAFEDAAGDYRIDVTDVATGLASRHRIRVQ